jgi:hypothetical protein
VLPEVASTMMLRPGSIRPSASAASIMATPILSLTLPPGLNDSSFAISSAPQSGATRVSLTIGVLPIRSARLSGIARVGGETLIRRPRVLAARLYSQNAMKGTPMMVVFFVCVLTPNVI